MRKVIVFIVAAVFGVGTFFPAVFAARVKKVAIAYYYDSPEYSTVIENFKTTLESSLGSVSHKVEFVTVTNQGDRDAFIASVKAIQNEVDMFFVPGTVNAMAVKEAEVTKPVIFSGVADPVAAKLVNTLEKPGTNFTGTHCAVPVDRQFKTFRAVVPGAKKIGLFYSPNDPAPLAQVKAWKAAIEAARLTAIEFFIPQEADSHQDIVAAASQMVGKVDVIVTMAEPKLTKYYDAVIEVADSAGLPYYSTLSNAVTHGALASVGFDFAAAARISAQQQAIAVLAGKDPGDMPVLTFPKYRLSINLKAARKLKLRMPEAVVQSANEVIR
jgi:putative tryptophan/tyrosine transport system substrate-binding protein